MIPFSCIPSLTSLPFAVLCLQPANRKTEFIDGLPLCNLYSSPIICAKTRSNLKYDQHHTTYGLDSDLSQIEPLQMPALIQACAGYRMVLISRPREQEHALFTTDLPVAQVGPSLAARSVLISKSD